MSTPEPTSDRCPERFWTQLELTAVDRCRERARTLRRAGLTMAEIHREFPGVPRTRVLGWVRDIRPARHRLRARAKDDVRRRARELRLADKTYTEIAAELGVSKSSVSVWCADLPRPLPKPGKKRASTWGSRLRRREEQRSAAKTAAREAVGSLSDRELFLIGVMLYWAEGSKDKPWRRSEQVKLINSDVDVIRTFEAWLDLLGIEHERRNYRVHIHESADVAGAQQFWADVVGVPLADMRRPTLKRHNPKTIRRNVGDSYRGCLIVTVRMSAKLYWRIDGAWQGIVNGALMTDWRRDPP
jgi:hypothetical protein